MGVLERFFGVDGVTAGPSDPLLSRMAPPEPFADPARFDGYALPTVVAARQLLADVVAMLPMGCVNQNGNDLETRPMLRRPDPSEPTRRSFERIVNNMTRHGRAWLHVTATGADSWPIAVEIVDAPRVSVQDHKPNGKILAANIDGMPVDPRNLVCVPLIVDRDPFGETPLKVIDETLQLIATVSAAGSSYYTSQAAPAFALKSPNRLTSPQVEQLLTQWAAARQTRRPAVLSGGIELEMFTQASAGESLLLDAASFFDSVVARIMQIPPSLLNTQSQSSLTYSTVGGEFSRWLSIGLRPVYLNRIESAFSELLPRNVHAKFDTTPLTGPVSAEPVTAPKPEVTV